MVLARLFLLFGSISCFVPVDTPEEEAEQQRRRLILLVQKKMIDPVTAVQDSIDALALSLFEALRGVRDAVATPSSSSSLVAPYSSDRSIPMSSAFQGDIDARISHGEENDINNNSTNINSIHGTNTSSNSTKEKDDETLLAKQQQQQARDKLLHGLNMDYFPPRAYDMLHPDYESFILSYLGGKDGYAKELVERFYSNSIQKTTATTTMSMHSTSSSGSGGGNDDDTKKENEKTRQSSESNNGDIIVNDRTTQPPPPTTTTNNSQEKTAETMGKDDKNEKGEEKVEEREESKQGQTNNKVSLGEVGYEFRKEFDSGWYTGRVVEIRPLAGKLCRDYYSQHHFFGGTGGAPITALQCWSFYVLHREMRNTYTIFHSLQSFLRKWIRS